MFRFNLHIALIFLGFTFVEVFGPVYFYQIGIPLPYITLYWSGFYLLRLITRPIALLLSMRFSLQQLLIGSAIGYSCRYLLYGMIQGTTPMLVALLVVESLTSAVYWLFYHVSFSCILEQQRVGRAVAWRDSAFIVVRILVPLGAALCIELLGYQNTFYITTVITLLGVLPLLSPQFSWIQRQSFSIKKLFSTDLSGGWLFLCSSFSAYGNDFLWRIALFLHIGNNYGFGGVVSLAIIFQIAGTFFIGHRFDLGKGIRHVQVGIVILVLAICGRALLTLTVPMAVALDFLMAIGTTFLGPYVNAMVYKRSKDSNDILTFQFLSESGWDVGAIISLLLATLLLGLGVPVQLCCLLGIPGYLGLWFMLSRVR
jgi:MFS family permease